MDKPTTEAMEQNVNNSFTGLANMLSPNPLLSQLSKTETLSLNNRYYFVSNDRALVSFLYAEHGIVQTFVNLPVDDAFRGGVEIRSGQLSASEISTLNRNITQLGAQREFIQAKKWARLYGGGAVLIVTDQDPSTPLRPVKEGERLGFRAVDMWELYFDGIRENSEEPFVSSVPMLEQTTHFNYYGTRVHKSRLILMTGATVPALLRPRMRGWGVSVVEAIVRSYNQFLKANNLSFEVLDEFKVDVFKFKNLLNSLMSPTGTTDLARRIAEINSIKSFQNAVVLSDQDDFSSKQLSFSGLAEVMQQIRIHISADLRMPLTKLFGVSSAGFNAGDDDIENYNAMVETDIRSKVQEDYLRLVGVVCQQLFGFVPDDLEINFKPLRVMSAEQEETIKDKIFARIFTSFQLQLISVREARLSINKANLLPIEISEDDMPNVPPLSGDEASQVQNPKVYVNSFKDKIKKWFGVGNDAEFERQHKRDGDGKFTEGGSTKKSKEISLQDLLGEEFTGVTGQAAIDKLLAEKRGHIKAAFTREDIGEIDLVWGNQQQGLSHILSRRKEQGEDVQLLMRSLADVLETGDCVFNPNTKRFEISKDGKMAVIDFRTDETASSRFVLTAFFIRKK